MEPLLLILTAAFWLTGFMILFRIPGCSRMDTGSPRACNVSVIIPARNEAGNLPRLLNSLRGQLPAHSEIIVVDEDRVKKRGLFGPSLILERELYDRVGGHESVKDKILEDYYLAERFNREGIPVHCCGGRGAISFRMYPNGLPDLVRGWSKAFAAGAGQTFLITLLAIVAWISRASEATRSLIHTAWTGPASASGLYLGLYLCYAAQVYWILRRIGTFGFYTALFFPVPLLFFTLVFAYSLFLLLARKPVSWKNRSVNTTGLKSP